MNVGILEHIKAHHVRDMCERESRKIARSPVYKINSVDSSNYTQCIREFMTASHDTERKGGKEFRKNVYYFRSLILSF